MPEKPPFKPSEFEKPRRFEAGPRAIRGLSNIFSENSLRKRIDQVVSSSRIKEYLAPKIEYSDKLAGKVKKGVEVTCVGAGKGHEIDEIDALLPGSKVTGLDPHDFYMTPVKKRLETLAHNASYLPENLTAQNMEGIKDESQDGLTMYFVLHHMDKENQSLALKEAYRVLKKDGYLFVAEDLARDKKEAKKNKIIDKIVNVEIKDRPHNYKNTDKWEGYFAEHGFKIVDRHEEQHMARHGYFVLQKIKPESKK